MNACATIDDKVSVAGIDAIASTTKLWADLIKEGNEHPEAKCSVTFANGATETFSLHDSFRKRERRLKGKCIDLEAAYRQCPVKKAHSFCAIFGLKNPETGEAEFFEAAALPFGAAAAVHGFNRAAAALRAILHEVTGVPCSNYFDDFTIVGPDEVIDDLDEIVHEVLAAFGWATAVEKEDPKGPGEEFAALGVEFDLRQALANTDPKIVVRKQAEQDRRTLRDHRRHLAKQRMSPHEARELRGRLVVSNSQAFGKLGATAFFELTRKAESPQGRDELGGSLKSALTWWKDHVARAKPRAIKVGPQRRPLLLFTDGSCEPDRESKWNVRAGFGAVLYDPEDDSLRAFGGYLGDKILGDITKRGAKKQVVGQAELYPGVLAKEVWGDAMRGRNVLHFVDNEAAKYGLIKGSSPTEDCAWLIQEYWSRECEAESHTWIERVPSASNCADPPSRCSWSILEQGGRPCNRVSLPTEFEENLLRAKHRRV